MSTQTVAILYFVRASSPSWVLCMWTEDPKLNKYHVDPSSLSFKTLQDEKVDVRGEEVELAESLISSAGALVRACVVVVVVVVEFMWMIDQI